MPEDPTVAAPGPGDAVGAVASLGEPTRRALYEYVVDAGDWVARDTAADAVGLERGTAAHHLDRLAADGLLDVDYQRRSGRRGPGAGRPAKLYRRARRDIDVSLPPRAYELAGRLLAEAADTSRVEGIDITSALDATARAEGRRLAEELRTRVPASARADARRRVVLDALAERGFEPHAAGDDTVVLGNCPFHNLAREHTDLICGMNLCLLDAAIDGVGDTGLDARLEPEEGFCCVKLHRIR
jgi:predicted ArsR family transcriptional regulator